MEPNAPAPAAPAPTPAPASLVVPLPTTPEAALVEIEQIRRDKSHPLHARGPEHAPAVERWGRLHEIAYPEPTEGAPPAAIPGAMAPDAHKPLKTPPENQDKWDGPGLDAANATGAALGLPHETRQTFVDAFAVGDTARALEALAGIAVPAGGSAACDADLKRQWGPLAPEGFAWAERGAQLYAARPGAQGKIARAALVDRGLRDAPAVNVFLAGEALTDEERRVTVQPKTREDAAYVRAFHNTRDPNHATAVSYVQELREMRHRLTGR